MVAETLIIMMSEAHAPGHGQLLAGGYYAIKGASGGWCTDVAGSSISCQLDAAALPGPSERFLVKSFGRHKYGIKSTVSTHWCGEDHASSHLACNRDYINDSEALMLVPLAKGTFAIMGGLSGAWCGNNTVVVVLRDRRCGVERYPDPKDRCEAWIYGKA